MDITAVVQAIIGLAAAVVTAFIIPFIRNKTTVQQREAIMSVIKTAVSAAEQMKNLNTGASKKGYVNRFLKTRGFKVDHTELDAMIESAVYDLNVTTADAGGGENA